MGLDVVDGAGLPQQIKTTPDGSTLVPHHHVDSLPAGVTNNIAATAAALAALVGHVDGLEALGTALNGFVDGLEGYTDTIETKLQAIVDNQAPPSTGPKFGQHTSIGSGADARFPDQPLSRGMTIENLDTTYELLVSHQTGPTPSGATTRRVKPGKTTTFIACTNANAVYMRCATASQTISACYDGV